MATARTESAIASLTASDVLVPQNRPALGIAADRARNIVVAGRRRMDPAGILRRNHSLLQPHRSK